MTPRLVFFTASYPFGMGENWKRDELAVFSRHFESIDVLPFSYAGNKIPKPLPSNVRAQTPVIEKLENMQRNLWKIFTGGRFMYYTSEFLRSRVYQKRSWLINWIVASIQTEFLCRSQAFQYLLSLKQYQPVLYFYWSREWAYVIPFLKRMGFDKIFVRFHGYDLYQDRQDNHGYIPYRHSLLNNIHTAILLSDSAEQYLHRLYPKIAFHSVVAPLGTIERGQSKPSEDGILRIISCSSVVSVKRLALIAEALQFADCSVEWSHIGTGPLFDELKIQIKTLPSNIRVNLVGKLQPDEVLKYYDGKVFDLFVNVSESEGMPVSIMEAFSAAIPTLATNVGGTRHLITSNTGILLPENPGPVEVWTAIRSFYDLSFDTKLQMRAAAYQHFKENFYAPVNAERLMRIFFQSE